MTSKSLISQIIFIEVQKKYMPKNLEMKVKLSSHKEIKTILKKNKIHLEGLLIQKDIYYKVDRGILKLRIENENQTLIFYNRNEKSKKRWSDYHLLKINNTDGNEYLKDFWMYLQSLIKKENYIFLTIQEFIWII